MSNQWIPKIFDDWFFLGIPLKRAAVVTAAFLQLFLHCSALFGQTADPEPTRLFRSLSELQERRNYDKANELQIDAEVRLSFATKSYGTIYVQDKDAATQVEINPQAAEHLSQQAAGCKLRIQGRLQPGSKSIILDSYEVLDADPSISNMSLGVFGTSDKTVVNGLAEAPINVREACIKADTVSIFGYRGVIGIEARLFESLSVEDVLPWIRKEIVVNGALFKQEDPDREALFCFRAMQRSQFPQPTSDSNLLKHYRSGQYQAKYFKEHRGQVHYVDRGFALILGEGNQIKKISSRFAASLQVGDNITVLEWDNGQNVLETRQIQSSLIYVQSHAPLERARSVSSDTLVELGIDNRRVTFEGGISKVVPIEHGYSIHIKSGKHSIVAQTPKTESIFPFQPFDDVKVTGIPWKSRSSTNDNGLVEIYIASVENISLMHRGIMVPAKIAWTGIGVTLAVVSCVLLWNQSLRTQVAKRTEKIGSVNSQLKKSFEAFRGAILVEDEYHRISNINQQFQSLCSNDGLLGRDSKTALEIIEELVVDKSEFRSFWLDARESETKIVEQVIVLKGTNRSVRASGSPVIDSEGKNRGFLWLFEDISDSLRMQQQLLQSQKMEAIGQLSGGFAHDFNNILTIIRSNLAMIRIHNGKGKSIEEFTESADLAIVRASDITRHLLDYSRLSDLNLKIVDINCVVQQAYSLLRGSIDQKINFRVETSRKPLFAVVDESRLEQVILNLGINARDSFLGGKGDIFLTTQALTIDDRELVEIIVSDNGCGMTASVRDRAFEPFFTTKEPGQGTGLGLAMASGIVAQLGGSIHCDSTPGIGTTFKVHLPRVGEPASSAQPESQAVDSIARIPLQILLVDDEASVRSAVSAMLEEIGCDVTTAENGIIAMNILNERQDFDKILLDLNMPEMSGAEVLKEIDRNWPWLSVVICSGYTTKFKQELSTGTHRVPKMLAKPFGLEELQTALCDE